MNTSGRNTPPDPSQYDMYAAFRTKERGEGGTQKSRQNPNRRSVYDVSEERKRKQQANFQYRTNAPPSKGSPTSYGQGRPSVYDQRAQRLQRQGQTRQNQGQQQSRMQEQPQAARRSSGQKGQTYGTRVQNTTGEAYRYGFHSSYRTADGRILDGFDKNGRPIYRDPANMVSDGSAAVIRRTSFAPDTVRNLKPTRRIRVETLADTDTKPFPFAIVFTVVLCTMLVMAVLYTYMQLNEQTNTLSTLSYRLSSLRAEAYALEAEVVRREDLLSIEQTAADTLGMVKTDVLTKKYVSIENEDKTEVVSLVKDQEETRVTIQIDLDTGKPITTDESRGNSYTPAEQNTQTTETPITTPDTVKTEPIQEDITSEDSDIQNES